MSSNPRHREEQPRHLRGRSVADWIETAGLLTACLLALYFKPFAHLFGFEAFEQSHGVWLEAAIVCGISGIAKAIYLYAFRRDAQRAEFVAIEDDIRQGRVKRMPFAARCVFLGTMLALVILGEYAREPLGARILIVAVPLFLLFAAIELSCVLSPGEAIIPDAADELLQFYRTRMLAAGYLTAILALIALYLTQLFAAAYLKALLPIVLCIALLVPAFVYRRLDQQAESDD